MTRRHWGSSRRRRAGRRARSGYPPGRWLGGSGRRRCSRTPARRPAASARETPGARWAAAWASGATTPRRALGAGSSSSAWGARRRARGRGWSRGAAAPSAAAAVGRSRSSSWRRRHAARVKTLEPPGGDSRRDPGKSREGREGGFRFRKTSSRVEGFKG